MKKLVLFLILSLTLTLELSACAFCWMVEESDVQDEATGLWVTVMGERGEGLDSLLLKTEAQFHPDAPFVTGILMSPDRSEASLFLFFPRDDLWSLPKGSEIVMRAGNSAMLFPDTFKRDRSAEEEALARFWIDMARNRRSSLLIRDHVTGKVLYNVKLTPRERAWLHKTGLAFLTYFSNEDMTDYGDEEPQD